jgi:hypothetical protein
MVTFPSGLVSGAVCLYLGLIDSLRAVRNRPLVIIDRVVLVISLDKSCPIR